MSAEVLKEIGGLEIVKEREPYRFEHMELANGGELYFQKAQIPFVLLGIVSKFGAREDPPGKEGLVHMLEHLLSRKTEDFPSFQAMEKYKEKHSLGINYGEINLNSLIFSGKSLKEDFPHLLHVFSQFISFSRYGSEDLVHEKDIVIEELQRKMLPQIRGAQNEIRKKIFGEHPFSRIDILGEEKIIAALRLEDIRKFEKQYLGPLNAAFILIGDFKPDEAKNLLTEAFPPRKCRLVSKYQPIPPPFPKGLRSEYSMSKLEIKGETRTTLRWDFSFSSRDFFKLGDIALSILTTKLSEELREKRGWTYGANEGWQRLRDLGTGWLGVSVPPRHEKETEKIFWQVRKETANDVQMFKTYQRSILKSFLITDVNYYDILDHGLRTIPLEGRIPLLTETYQETAALTPQAFQNFLENYIVPSRVHLTIARP